MAASFRLLQLLGALDELFTAMFWIAGRLFLTPYPCPFHCPLSSFFPFFEDRLAHFMCAHRASIQAYLYSIHQSKEVWATVRTL
jgi:hypothetical protein